MRAKRLVSTSFECAQGTAGGRRRARNSGWGLPRRLPLILAGALALLALWRPAPRWGDFTIASRDAIEVTERRASVGTDEGTSSDSSDVDTFSFKDSGPDAAVLPAAVALASLMFSHLLLVTGCKLRSGTMFRPLVPG